MGADFCGPRGEEFDYSPSSTISSNSMFFSIALTVKVSRRRGEPNCSEKAQLLEASLELYIFINIFISIKTINIFTSIEENFLNLICLLIKVVL